jgi:hypothetical protein
LLLPGQQRLHLPDLLIGQGEVLRHESQDRRRGLAAARKLRKGRKRERLAWPPRQWPVATLRFSFI